MAVFLLLWVERFGEEPKARVFLQHDARLLFSARPRRGGRQKRTRIISIFAATATEISTRECAAQAAYKQFSTRSGSIWVRPPPNVQDEDSDVQSSKCYLQSRFFQTATTIFTIAIPSSYLQRQLSHAQ